MSIRSSLKKIAVLLILVITGVFALTACGGANVDEPVTADNVNSSSTLAAEGFIQSIFTEDETLFYSCFPENVFDDDDQAFETYVTSSQDIGVYIGCRFQNYNKITEENGYDSDWMRSNISLIHGISEDSIIDMEIVKLQVCFEGENNKKYDSVDVYIVVYQMDGNWYAFEMQNSDAEFAA